MIILSSTLAASAVMAGAVGGKVIQKGGIGTGRSIEYILNNTGRCFGDEITHVSIKRRLIQADLDLPPEYISGLQHIMPLSITVLLLPFCLLGLVNIFLVVFPAAAMYFLPGSWLSARVKKRVIAISSDIPDFCALLGTALASGADLKLALEQVSAVMTGELAAEVKRALQDMATGDSRSTALNKMAGRCGVPELTGLVRKIQQAMRYGGKSLEPVVRHHAEKILLRKKYEMQKTAGELTIKLLFPIIIFVMAPLFVFLGFPVIWNIIEVFN